MFKIPKNHIQCKANYIQYTSHHAFYFIEPHKNYKINYFFILYSIKLYNNYEKVFIMLYFIELYNNYKINNIIPL